MTIDLPASLSGKLVFRRRMLLQLRRLSLTCLLALFCSAAWSQTCEQEVERLESAVETDAPSTLAGTAQLWAAAKTSSDVRCQILTALLRARAQRYLGDMAAAQRSLYEALELAQPQEFTVQRARILARLGQLAENFGDLEAAISRLTQAVELADSDRETRAYALNLLGHAYQTADKTEFAATSFEAALALYTELKMPAQIASVQLNMSLLERSKKDTGRARSFAELALKGFRASGNRRGAAGALQILGNLAIDEKRFDTGIAVHREALSEWQALGDAFGIATAQTSLARGLKLAAPTVSVNTAKPMLDEAARLLQSALEYKSDARTLASLLATRRLLAEVQDARGQHANAFETMSEYSDLRHSVFLDASRRRVDALSTEFSLRQEQAARVAAEQQAELSRRSAELRGRMLLAVGIALLVGLVGFWFVRMFRARSVKDRHGRQVAERQLSTALQFAPIGMLIVDPQERIQQINLSALRLLAIEPAEPADWINQPLSELRDRLRLTDADGNPIPLNSLPLRAALVDGTSAEHIELLLHAPLRVRHLLLSAAVILDDQSKALGAVCGIADISPLRAAESERTRLQERIAQAEKFESMQLMVSSLAHEFSNQLQTAQGHLDLAQEQQAELDLGPALLALQRSVDLVSRLQTLSGFTLSDREPIPIGDLIARALARIHTRFPGATIKTELSNPEVRVLVDPEYLCQAIGELCFNAIEVDLRLPIFLGVQLVSDPASVRGSMLLPPEKAGSYVEISVVDHSTGFDEAIKRRAFDPFVSSKSKSRGLGLTLVHGIVRAHRGGLFLATGPAEGTRFAILLPALRS